MKRSRETCHPSSQEVPPLLMKIRTHHLLPQAGLRTEGLNSSEVSHGRLNSRWLGSNHASLQKLFRLTCIAHVHMNAPNMAHTHVSHAYTHMPHTVHIPHAHSHTCLASVPMCTNTAHIPHTCLTCVYSHLALTLNTHALHMCTHTLCMCTHVSFNTRVYSDSKHPEAEGSERV